MRTELELVALLQTQDCIIGFAKLAGAFDDRLEDWFDVGRRGGDHLQDIGAAGLVGEGLGEIAGLGLHLVEQPDIADRDHGLIGEGLQQADLLVAERDGLQRDVTRLRRCSRPRAAGARASVHR